MTNPIRKIRVTKTRTMHGHINQPVLSVTTRELHWCAICPECGGQIDPYPRWVPTTRKRAKDALYVHLKLIHAGPGGDTHV